MRALVSFIKEETILFFSVSKGKRHREAKANNPRRERKENILKKASRDVS